MALLPEDITQINQLIGQYFSANLQAVKLSTLPLASTLEGLHTMGVDASNNSVRVSLQFVKDATTQASDAADLADQKAAFANGKALLAIEAAGAANTAAAATKPLRFIWDETRLGLKFEGDPDFVYTDLKGATGNSLEFAWNGTRLGVRVEGQPAYTEVELGGKDAYQIALALDPTIGTEEEWIQSLKQPALDAAEAADAARLAIQNDLAAKAAHGYGTEPQKTLKEVDDNLVQLAAESNIKDAEQDASIKTIEQLLSQSNLNQTAQVSSTGREIVSLLKTASNGGMDVKLEGLTASQKITNGNFANGITGWVGHSGAVLSVLNGKLKVALSSTTYGAARKDNISIISGNKYYKAILLNHDSATSETLNFQLGANADTSMIVANVNTLRSIIQTASTTGNTSLYVGKYSQTTVFNIFIERVMLVDLTATFGSGNEPDLATCDKIFSTYFEGTKSFVPTGRIRSIGKNMAKVPAGSITLGGLTAYRDGNSVVIKGATVGAGVAIRLTDILRVGYGIGSFDSSFSGNSIGGAGSYVITISRTGTGGAIYAYRDNGYVQLVTTVNPVAVTNSLKGVGFYVGAATSVDTRITIQIERGTVASAIEPYRSTNLYLTAPDLKSVPSAKDEIRKGASGYEHVKRILSKTLVADDIASLVAGANVDYVTIPIGKFTNWHGLSSTGTAGHATIFDSRFSKEASTSGFDLVANAGTHAYGAVNFLLIFAKGTYADLAAAKTGLTGITINYKALTSIITPIDHAGILNSAESGTIYHEPVMPDAGVYSTKMDIFNLDYPISALEEIRVHKNGIDTYLDVSVAVIAADGKSFTHPSLANGDTVLFTYLFNKEKVSGLITVIYYDGTRVRIDSVTGKAYVLDWSVANGVKTEILKEV